MAANPTGQIVAISNTGATNQSYSSSDGVTWAGPGSVPYTSTNPTWLAGNWYITNSNGSTWLSSSNGVTWTSATGTGSGMYQIAAIAAVNGNLIAGGGAPWNANKQVQISTNRLISVGTGTNDQINWSDDSRSIWVHANFTPTDYVKSICWTPLGIFAGTGGATIYRSTDNGANFGLSSSASTAVTGIAYKIAE